MRKLCLMMAVLAAAVAACDDDSNGRPARDASTGLDSDIVPPPSEDAGEVDTGTPPTECEQEVPPFPPYDGELVWTFADYEKCFNACGAIQDEDEYAACVEANCVPGEEDFFDCVNDTFFSCLTETAGSCRGQWAAYACCDIETCAGQPDSCFETMCADEGEQVDTCIGEALDSAEGDFRDPCWDTVGLCFAPPVGMDGGAENDAGTSDGGVSDGGTDGGTDAGSTGDAAVDGGTNNAPTPPPSMRVRSTVQSKQLKRTILRSALRTRTH